MAESNTIHIVKNAYNLIKLLANVNKWNLILMIKHF